MKKIYRILACVLTLVCTCTLFILSVLTGSYCVLRPNIVIPDRNPKAHSFQEHYEASSKAQYGGYYEGNVEYLNRTFMNEPWFGYAHYDIYTQTMTIHLREMDETYIALVDEYIAENDKGGCTFVYDTTDVSYASVHWLIETMRRNYGLFCSLGIEFFVFIDGDLCIKISKPYLEWISIPLIEFLADKHTKLLFFYD